MEFTAVIAGAVAGALITSVVGYMLGYRRLRLERVYEQRALVIAEISRLLWYVNRNTVLGIYQYPDTESNRKRLEHAKRSLTELTDYFGSNNIWLEPSTSEKLKAYIEDVSSAAGQYLDDLERRGDLGPAGRAAENRIKQLVPTTREELEAEFRAVLYPAPWYEPLLRFLEWIETRGR